MKKKVNYKTKTKEMTIDKIINYDGDFTASDIYLSLDKKVGLTTVYRVINDLVNKKNLNVVNIVDNKTQYRYLGNYDKNNQLFIKCEKCNNLTRIDCDCYIELYNHILKFHEFELTKNHIVINGKCRKCMR